jgi:hypothetical protein
MNKFLSAFTITALLLLVVASTFAQKTYNAKRKTILNIVGTKGTNGCSVVYNPDKKVYYANIAGNAEYPIETFSKKGNNLLSQETGFDLRGLWYNPDSKKLEANGYGDNGIVSYEINNNGSPASATVIFDGSNHQPSDQSVGVYDPEGKKIYYFSEGEIHVYNRSNGDFNKSFQLKNSPVDYSSFNYTSVIFTGRGGFELGLLNYLDKEICLFNLNGNYSGKIKLPSDAITHDAFRFSFANGKIWLYDVDTRSWTGYSF